MGGGGLSGFLAREMGTVEPVRPLHERGVVEELFGEPTAEPQVGVRGPRYVRRDVHPPRENVGVVGIHVQVHVPRVGEGTPEGQAVDRTVNGPRHHGRRADTVLVTGQE